MAIWHPSLTFYQDEYCTGLWWGGLLKNPTGLYPSLTTPGQLDAGCYWYDPKLLPPCWAPAFYQCRNCCCKPMKCGIPNEVTMIVSGFSGTATSIDHSSDYGYSPSKILDCGMFWQKNCDVTVYPFYDCWRLPPHSAWGCWHMTDSACCNRDNDTFFWWPRDSFRGTQDSTGADLCNRTRSICYKWPNLCTSTGHSGPSYGGITPPRWIMTCEPCCGWEWFYWENPDPTNNNVGTDKRTVIGAADCPWNRTNGYNYNLWYWLYQEFKYETPDGEEIDTIRWQYRDPYYPGTYMWPPGWRGLSSRNLIPYGGAFWNSWHIDHQNHSRSPFYENCAGGYWNKYFFNSFPNEPRDGGYENWCDNLSESWPANVNWIYRRPPIVLVSQPSLENCHYCWSGVTNLLNYSTDGHCNGACHVNLSDLNNTLVAQSSLHIRPPNFNVRLTGRNRPYDSIDTQLLYMVDNMFGAWSYSIDYPCYPKKFSFACMCYVCDTTPGLAAPRLKPMYLNTTGYGAKFGFDMRIYCMPMTPTGEPGMLWNGGWWYIDNVWIERDSAGRLEGGAGYVVGDRFHFDYYEAPRRGGEMYWPAENGTRLQEMRVVSVNAYGGITAVEMVQHVQRWGAGDFDEYPEDWSDFDDVPVFSPGLGSGVPSNTATKTISFGPAQATPPGAPQNLSVTPQLTGALIEWDAPASNGGSAITSYVIYVKDSLGNEPIRGATASPFTLTGLSAGSTYRITVAARNLMGIGDRTGEAVLIVPRSSEMKMKPTLPVTALSTEPADRPTLASTSSISPVVTLVTSTWQPTYYAGNAFVSVDPDILVEGDEYVQITSATITISGTQSAGDVLELSEGWRAGNRRVLGEYDNGAQRFTLYGPATREEYEMALQAMVYRFDGQDPTLGGTRTSIEVTFQVSAVDMASRSTALSPVILNLGCGRFFRQFRPPLYARSLSHRYSVAVPGTNYLEGDVLKWEAEMNPPTGTIATGYKYNPYWDTTTTPRRYAYATVVEVDDNGGVVDWAMCGATNQWVHPELGAYNPSEDGTGFWPDQEFDWSPSSYEFYCRGLNEQGDYWDIAYANRCDYCYEGYIPLRYSWSGIAHVLSKNHNGYCDHTWAKFNYRIEQISVKTDINVIDPPSPDGRKAKLRLVDVDDRQQFRGCEITPVRWINGEEAPGPSIFTLEGTDLQSGYKTYYRAHDIPVKQGSITENYHIQIVDPGSGYQGIPLNTWNGTIQLVNVNDDMRAWMLEFFGFYAYAHFQVTQYTSDGGIAAIEVLPDYPGYWYFVQQDAGEVWFNTVSTDWYFEMAWPSTANKPIYDDPSPDCRAELSAEIPCCHATRDNWGFLTHYDGFPEPFQTSMYGYQRTIRIFNPETDAMWWGTEDYVDAIYRWWACGFGSGGAPYGNKPSITGSPGYAMAGDIDRRWTVGDCPTINRTYRMVYVHPCAACAWEQGLPGGQGCLSPGGEFQNTYSPSHMDAAFAAGVNGIAGSGPSWNGGNGQAWITALGGAPLNVQIIAGWGTDYPPPAGDEGDI